MHQYTAAAVWGRQDRRWQQPGREALQHGARHLQRAGQDCHAVGAPHPLALLVLAVVVQRHRAADRMVGAEARVAVLDVEILVEQPRPQQHRLAGEIGIHLVERARHADSRVAADLRALRLAPRWTGVAIPRTVSILLTPS